MNKRVCTALVILAIAGLLTTALGHGILGTNALLGELRKANINAEWISAIKAVWILLSANLVFFAGLIAALFFRKNPISSRSIANSIAFLLLAESGYLFFELGVFPGAMLMLFSGALLLSASRISPAR
jgi:hypothetical protein